MRNKRYRKNSKLRMAAVGGTFLILSPLMIMTLIENAPSADSAIIYVADASARLAVGDVFLSNDDILTNNNIINVNDNIDSVRYAHLPVDNIPNQTKKLSKMLTFDDSQMLSYGSLDMPSSDNEELYVDDSSVDAGPKPYPESIESRDGNIAFVQYGKYNGDEFLYLDGAGQVKNVTYLSNDVLLEESRKKPEFTIETNGEPQILIMHTHTTESFEPYERDFFDASFSSRTTDERMNVVSVGNAIQKELEAAGIGVIHDTEMYDYPSYNGSYDRSRISVQRILDENPSIKIVLDIHRDSIERNDGTRIAPLTEIDGKSAAQVMIISGCDDGTMNMPNYMQNFRLASLLQTQLETDYPTLTRPVLFDYRKYNQDLTTGSLLIEVGGHANSIDQAIYSGTLVGKSIVEALT